MLTNIKGLIFDLDGTLINSMHVWEKIDKDYLTSRGHIVPPNIKEKITHLSLTETANYFKETFNIDDTVEEIISTWNEMAYKEYSLNIKLKDGVLEFLNYLKSNNYKIALATSNSIPLLTAVLKNNKVYHLFDAISTSDEVGKSKANPDIYLLSAKKLKVDPNECLVFEDIVQAIKGAKLANMKTVSVFDNQSQSELEELKKESDFYIESYKNII